MSASPESPPLPYPHDYPRESFIRPVTPQNVPIGTSEEPLEVRTEKLGNTSQQPSRGERFRDKLTLIGIVGIAGGLFAGGMQLVKDYRASFMSGPGKEMYDQWTGGTMCCTLSYLLLAIGAASIAANIILNYYAAKK